MTMSQPSITIQEPSAAFKAVANLLPCRVHHDGPIDPVDTYWKPTDTPEGTKEAYFRGRKLHGQPLSLPTTHRGVILERKANEQQAVAGNNADDDLQETVEVGKMAVTAEFDELVVWGHEKLARTEDDTFMRGVEEWLGAAEKIHSWEDKDE